MPDRRLLERSSTPAVNARTSFLPEPDRQLRRTKRKREVDTEGDEERSIDGSRMSSVSKKLDHSVCEKRYRNKLNVKIVALRERIPSLRRTPKGSMADNKNKKDGDGLDDLKAATKFDKATVLSKAIEYISRLEECNKRFVKEDLVLKTRVVAFEKLASAGSLSTRNDVCCARGTRSRRSWFRGTRSTVSTQT